MLLNSTDAQSSPLPTFLSQWYITTDKPMQIHHNHPKTIIYIIAHFFINLDAAPSMDLEKCTMTCIIPLWYYTEYFHCPRKLLCQTYSLLPHLLPSTLGNHWSFYCLKSFAFSRMPYTVCSLFRLVSFT